MTNKRLLLGIGTISAWIWIGIQLSFENHDVPSVCMIKNVSGYPCPACGISRSIVYLLHGEVSQAFMTNPLGFLGLGMLLVFTVLQIIDIRNKKTWSSSLIRYLEVFLMKRAVIITFALLMIFNWLWNIQKGL